jgi:hypothetical protein
MGQPGDEHSASIRAAMAGLDISVDELSDRELLSVVKQALRQGLERRMLTVHEQAALDAVRHTLKAVGIRAELHLHGSGELILDIAGEVAEEWDAEGEGHWLAVLPHGPDARPLTRPVGE